MTDYSVACCLYECTGETLPVMERYAKEFQDKKTADLIAKGAKLRTVKSGLKKDKDTGKSYFTIAIFYETEESPALSLNAMFNELKELDIPKDKQPTFMYNNTIPDTFKGFILNHVSTSPEGFAEKDKVFNTYIKCVRLHFGESTAYKPLVEEYHKHLEEMVKTAILSREEFEKRLKAELLLNEVRRRSGLRTKPAWQGIKLQVDHYDTQSPKAASRN